MALFSVRPDTVVKCYWSLKQFTLIYTKTERPVDRAVGSGGKKIACLILFSEVVLFSCSSQPRRRCFAFCWKMALCRCSSTTLLSWAAGPGRWSRFPLDSANILQRAGEWWGKIQSVAGRFVTQATLRAGFGDRVPKEQTSLPIVVVVVVLLAFRSRNKKRRNGTTPWWDFSPPGEEIFIET